MTAYLYRIVAIVPVARRDALVAWMVANLGADWSDSFTSPLVPVGSPSGATPTHYWASFACTDTQAKALMIRVTGQTSLSQPGGWDSWTHEQKRDWIINIRVTIRNAIGVEILGSYNDGAWESSSDALVALNLTPLSNI